jgi:hypothetical protein
MKLRDGFVTNSSSSSFVVAYKDKEDLKISPEVAQEFANRFFEEYASGWYETKDVEDLKYVMVGEYCLDEGEIDDPESFYGKLFLKCKARIENGETIRLIQLHTDNEDLCMSGYESLCELLNALPEKNLIEGDGSF